MDASKYKVNKTVDSPSGGYRLEGPGLHMERVYHGDEVRERLENLADLMNFAFEQGRRIVENRGQSDQTLSGCAPTLRHTGSAGCHNSDK